jgi:hypothetical protein
MYYERKFSREVVGSRYRPRDGELELLTIVRMAMGLRPRSCPDYPRVTSRSPQKRRDREPQDCAERERPSGSIWREKPQDCAEGGETYSAKARAGCVERGGVLAAPSDFQPLFFLPLALMFFNQRGAREKDCRHCEKQSSYDRTPDIPRHAGHDRCEPAEKKAQDEFGPASVFDRGELESDDHF